MTKEKHPRNPAGEADLLILNVTTSSRPEIRIAGFMLPMLTVIVNASNLPVEPGAALINNTAIPATQQTRRYLQHHTDFGFAGLAGPRIIGPVWQTPEDRLIIKQPAPVKGNLAVWSTDRGT